jgi:hypothetical protein
VRRVEGEVSGLLVSATDLRASPLYLASKTLGVLELTNCNCRRPLSRVDWLGSSRLPVRH